MHYCGRVKQIETIENTFRQITIDWYIATDKITKLDFNCMKMRKTFQSSKIFF